jgi:protein required for attachment to host cells
MINKAKKKLLLVADSKSAKFYRAEDFEIKALLREFSAEDLEIHHHRQERKTGKFNKLGANARFFDPHTEAKDLDRRDFCKFLIHEVSKIFEEEHYDQLILVCGPKMLGDFRDDFPHSFRNIEIKECIKELIHDNMKELEEKVLGELKFK